MSRRCADCRFWSPLTGLTRGEGFGECRKYAPRPRTDSRESHSLYGGAPLLLAWQSVSGDDWCGEFERATKGGYSPKPGPCVLIFRGRECKYTGSHTDCRKTFSDCVARGNEANFRDA